MLEDFTITHDPLDGMPIDLAVTPPKAPGRAIIAEVAKAHRITPEEITGPSRKQACVRPRHAAMRRVRQELGYSFPQIGRLFNRDHSTVIFACRLKGEPMPADTIGHNGAPDMAGVDLTQKLDAAAAAYQRHYGRPRTIAKLKQMAEAREEAQRVLEDSQRG